MKSYVRGLVLLVFVLAVVLLGGAGRSVASTTNQCRDVGAPQGRLFCVQVVDTDNVSPSGLVGTPPRQETVTAYQYYKFTVTNLAGSTLTNGTLSVVLTDNFFKGLPSANSTALFVPSGSSPSCAVVSTNPNRVDCVLGNLAAGATGPTFTLAYRTSNSADVQSTDAGVTVGFKEGTNPNGANPSFLNFTENTSLEPDPEKSTSWSPSNQFTNLGTCPTCDSQWSTVGFTVPANKPPFTSDLSEDSSGTLCASGLSKCFGEVVNLSLPVVDPNTFSPTNPFHLTITLIPGDFNVTNGDFSNLGMVHQATSTSTPVLVPKCSSNPPPATDPLPCFFPSKLSQGSLKLWVFDVYGVSNGGWHPGAS